MIVVATILADRKASSQMIGIPAAMKLDTTGIEGGIRYYINIETASDYPGIRYRPLREFLQSDQCTVPWDLDTWRWDSNFNSQIERWDPAGASEFAWRKRPQYDQDQRRLQGICMARNMAREYAMAMGASHLFFVDADVIVPPNALQRLIALDHPLAGGMVPGRGAHSGVWYVFGIYAHEFRQAGCKHLPLIHPEEIRCRTCEMAPSHTIHKRSDGRLPPKAVPGHGETVIEVEHGTCGCLLIQRRAFSTLAFRSGLSRQDMTTPLSEDPAFASDSFLNGFGRWWIDKNVRCQHWDDPAQPLTDDQVSKNNTIPK